MPKDLPVETKNTSAPRFRSFAEWPADVYTSAKGDHVSTDDHHTKEEADGVCAMLMRHGFGGKGRRPVLVWVEELPSDRKENVNPSTPAQAPPA
jgi:hypothetical protein